MLKDAGHKVVASDIIDRGYEGTVINDFLQSDLWSEHLKVNDCDIITNPPYKFATEFVEKALDEISDGHKVAMLLKITFLEGQSQYKLFTTTPPKRVYVFSKRTSCMINGDFSDKSNGAVCYAWFVWEKGYKGDTVLRWIPPSD